MKPHPPKEHTTAHCYCVFKGAVRLASTVMVQVGEILKISNLAKFQSIFENTPLFFEIFGYFFTF